MLIIWIRDMIHKKIPIDTAIIREQALYIYNYFSNSGKSSNETFVVSKEWFKRFKNRFSLHDVPFTGEKASADYEAAHQFPINKGFNY